MLKDLIRRKFPILVLSPDSYQRHRLASSILVREGCDTILDVGGGTNRFFRVFLPKKKSLTLDKEGGDVIGDGTRLPFDKNRFDAVTCLETLQYVKKSDRKKFVNELMRVARKCVIISIPIDDPLIRSYEAECNSFHKELFGEGNRWLDAHKKLGLPDEKEINDILKGHEVERYSICNLKRWKKVLKFGLVLTRLRLTFALSAINAIYISLYGLDCQDPTYTKMFLIREVSS